MTKNARMATEEPVEVTSEFGKITRYKATSKALAKVQSWGTRENFLLPEVKDEIAASFAFMGQLEVARLRSMAPTGEQDAVWGLGPETAIRHHLMPYEDSGEPHEIHCVMLGRHPAPEHAATYLAALNDADLEGLRCYVSALTSNPPQCPDCVAASLRLLVEITRLQNVRPIISRLLNGE